MDRGEEKEKGGEIEVNILSFKSWTEVKYEKGLNGIQAKGRSW